ncbi:hypothetical protein U1Q18_048884 [Sarracenia purpurea var. burkii]
MEDKWLRLGDLSEYERERIRRIKENNDKLNSLRLKNIVASVLGSVQPKHASEKGKRKRVDVDDDDYRQPNSEDHSDDEFSNSFEYEVTNMPLSRRQLRNREISSSTDICTQSNPPTEVNVEAQANLTASVSIGKKLLSSHPCAMFGWGSFGMWDAQNRVECSFL